MAKYTIDSSTLTAIANAIRQKRGTSSNILVSNFASEILLINGGGGRPTIPNGYWQFKTTDPYKYVILGTDDSTTSDPYFYRLCRSYGFPYTCNVITDYMDRRMSTDEAEGFTEDDAPALFESAPTTREFLTTCKDRTDIEFALHGSSAKHLVSSDKLTDELWSTYYSAYTTEGGTKSLADFKTAFMEAISDYDVAQDAPYVERARGEIEEVIGKYVDTCGIWGGTGTATVDGIELSINEIGSNNYAWRENGYTALGYYLVGQFTPGYVDKTEDYIRHLQRDSGGIGDFVDNYNRMKVGDCIELFHHFTDSANIASHKQSLATIKQYVDANKVRVVTRKQYAELGEYVANPIVSIDVTRTSATINVGDTDSKDNYTIIATYLDNTTADVTEEAIVELIDTSVAGVVNVPAYYRGFQDTVMVDVQSGGGSNVLEPTIINKLKIDSTEFKLVTATDTNNVYRYDVTGLSTIYINSTKSKQYQQGWSDVSMSTSGDYLSHGENVYYKPTDNPNEVTVPEGMNYFYLYSNAGGDVAYPWTITKVPTN